MRILIDATLPLIDIAFPAPFIINKYASREALDSLLPDQDILVCRSTLKVDATLLKDSALQYIATASSGTDHIDKSVLKDKQITLMDAKGCNAHSVADYVLTVLSALDKSGIPVGQKSGLIGRGAVGSEVLLRLQSLGFDVLVFDPPLASRDASFQSCSLKDLAVCDIVFIHAELHDLEPWPSRNLLDAAFLNTLKPETIVINASRGGIVNEDALLKLPFQIHYCTDVFENEPKINPQIVRYATLCTPHIAGHSMEAKEAAVMMLSQQIHALCGLNPPVFSKSYAENAILLQRGQILDDALLAFYDPLLESNALKKDPGNVALFQKLRSAHNRKCDLRFL